MRILCVVVLIIIAAAASAFAKQATLQERTGFSISIADYIRDVGRSNAFGSRDIEIGATVIGSQWALADWRSEDGERRGHVSYFHVCDSWIVDTVTTGSPLHPRDFEHPGLGGMPPNEAGRLVAELKQAEQMNIAFLKPARAQGSC